jgi:hypothetical protein
MHFPSNYRRAFVTPIDESMLVTPSADWWCWFDAEAIWPEMSLQA